jgi:hypothetical protein
MNTPFQTIFFFRGEVSFHWTSVSNYYYSYIDFFSFFHWFDNSIDICVMIVYIKWNNFGQV